MSRIPNIPFPGGRQPIVRQVDTSDARLVNDLEQILQLGTQAASQATALSTQRTQQATMVNTMLATANIAESRANVEALETDSARARAEMAETDKQMEAVAKHVQDLEFQEEFGTAALQALASPEERAGIRERFKLTHDPRRQAQRERQIGADLFMSQKEEFFAALQEQRAQHGGSVRRALTPEFLSGWFNANATALGDSYHAQAGYMMQLFGGANALSQQSLAQEAEFNEKQYEDRFVAQEMGELYKAVDAADNAEQVVARINQAMKAVGPESEGGAGILQAADRGVWTGAVFRYLQDTADYDQLVKLSPGLMSHPSVHRRFGKGGEHDLSTLLDPGTSKVHQRFQAKEVTSALFAREQYDNEVLNKNVKMSGVERMRRSKAFIDEMEKQVNAIGADIKKANPALWETAVNQAIIQPIMSTVIDVMKRHHSTTLAEETQKFDQMMTLVSGVFPPEHNIPDNRNHFSPAIMRETLLHLEENVQVMATAGALGATPREMAWRQVGENVGGLGRLLNEWPELQVDFITKEMGGKIGLFSSEPPGTLQPTETPHYEVMRHFGLLKQKFTEEGALSMLQAHLSESQVWTLLAFEQDAGPAFGPEGQIDPASGAWTMAIKKQSQFSYTQNMKEAPVTLEQMGLMKAGKNAEEIQDMLSAQSRGGTDLAINLAVQKQMGLGGGFWEKFSNTFLPGIPEEGAATMFDSGITKVIMPPNLSLKVAALRHGIYSSEHYSRDAEGALMKLNHLPELLESQLDRAASIVMTEGNYVPMMLPRLGEAVVVEDGVWGIDKPGWRPPAPRITALEAGEQRFVPDHANYGELFVAAIRSRIADPDSGEEGEILFHHAEVLTKEMIHGLDVPELEGLVGKVLLVPAELGRPRDRVTAEVFLYRLDEEGRNEEWQDFNKRATTAPEAFKQRQRRMLKGAIDTVIPPEEVAPSG